MYRRGFAVGEPGFSGDQAIGEHLQRCCMRCGYTWMEACLDPLSEECREGRHSWRQRGVWVSDQGAYAHPCERSGCTAVYATYSGILTP